MIAIAAAALIFCAVHAASTDPDSLLVRFQPVIYLEDNGPQGARVDFPTAYTFDDADIEDNFQAAPPPPSVVCYGSVHGMRDSEGKVCWVICYDYYYPRNWTHVGLIGIEWKGWTHEHDWEWVYVIAGSCGGRILPYCACFSTHAAQNRDLFGVKGAVRLFPGITGGSVWKRDWSRDPALAPRVSLWAGDRVEATVMSTGNEVDGSGTQLRDGDPFAEYPLRTYEARSSSCADAAIWYYGDPELSPLCIFCSPASECGDPILPPWSRDGLDGNRPLPFDFALPEDWDESPSTELRPFASRLAVFPNPTRGELQVRWLGSAPIAIDLFDASGRRRWGKGHIEAGEGVTLSPLPSGIYWLRARSAQTEEARRVVVIR